MIATWTEGWKATVFTGEGRSISRESLHPEEALDRVQDWARKQREFAEKHGIDVTVTIEPIHGKRLE